MTNDILAIFDLDTKTALAVIAMILAVSLILFFKKRLIQDFINFEQKLLKWENIIEQKFVRWETQMVGHINDTRSALIEHSNDLDRATKSINEEMYRTKEKLYDSKQELLEKIDSLRDVANYLEREFKVIAATMKTTTDHFEEKFGKVIAIRAELESAYGRIIHLEGDYKDLKTQYAKHTEWFTQIVNQLKEQRSEIRNFRKV